MKKVLVNLYIPALDESYDLLVLEDKRLSQVFSLLMDAINNMYDFKVDIQNNIYDRNLAVLYNNDFTVRENGIVNGTKLIVL